MKFIWSLFYIILTALICVTIQSSEKSAECPVEISLENSSSSNPLAYSKRLVLFPNETCLISIADFPREVNFAIIQAHAFSYNVTLSYAKTLRPTQYVTGTNIGLNIMNNSDLYLINRGPHVNITVMVIATVYPNTDPVPGGCNMELETNQAPYMKLKSLDGMNEVQASPALVPNTTCGVPKLTYDMYHYFLPSKDFTEDTYFESLLYMMTPKTILENGIQSASRFGPALSRLYDLFIGNGIVYVAMATIENTTYQAAYVPILTYSCSVVYPDNSCDVLQSALSKILCAFIFFLGLFLCLIGHRCFNLQMFLSGGILGGLLAYILASVAGMSYSALLWSTLLGCLVGGVATWKIWGCIGLPLYAVMAPGLILGYLMAGLVTTYIPDGLLDLQSNTIYWSLYMGLTLSTAILVGALLCCGSFLPYALLGSVAVTFPFDYYFGGHIQYIVINNIRRVSETNFQYAVVKPPFQSFDIWMMAARVLWTLATWYLNRKTARGQPPFPPRNSGGAREGRSRGFRPRRYWTPNHNAASRPLIGSSRRVSYGSDDVFY